MAPKKAAQKKVEEPLQVNSLYVRREPLPPPNAPDVADAEVAWKATRNQTVLPLPPWDDEAVNTTEWNPNEVETLFASDSFAARVLPRSLMKDIVGWRRAHIATETPATEEREPQAKPLPELEEPPPPDPKGKDAKAKKAPEPPKGKKGAPPPEPEKVGQTTAEQFENVEPGPNDGLVVTPMEFRSREPLVTNDESAPPLSQAIASQFAIIAEHRQFLPRGSFLWELIYPQDEEGMPLFNPNGKYIVKLFLQGCWRQVLIDDVVPVGIAAAGTGAVHAPVFASAVSPGVIWPQLLSKALLRAYQADLQASMLPVIMALTGWVPCQMGFSWNGLRASLNTRIFCVFQRTSEVDVELKQKDGASAQAEGKKVKVGNAAEVPALSLGAGMLQAMPKLGAQPVDAVMQFLACEVVDDPPQVRLKAATWRPAGGTPRRAVYKEYESEADEEEFEEDEAHRVGEDGTVATSDVGDQDDEDDEADYRSQQSPSAKSPTAAGGGTADGGGGDPSGASARSKEDGGGGSSVAEPGTGTEDGAKATGEAATEPLAGTVEEEPESPEPCPWPESPPALKQMRSVLLEYHKDLVGGFWMLHTTLADVCDKYFAYLPRGERLLSERLDTMWARERKDPYVPKPLHLLKLQLVPEKIDREDAVSGDVDEHPRRGIMGPSWHSVVIVYEPLRLDPIFGPSRDTAAASPGAVMQCMLRCVSSWKPPTAPADDAESPGNMPGRARSGAAEGDMGQAAGVASTVGFLVGEGASDWTSSVRSLSLPPGEHWYLVQDDAIRAGSVLSVHVDGSQLDMSASSIEFKELTSALDEVGLGGVAMEPAQYPVLRPGFSILAKAEVDIAPRALEQVSHLQLVAYIMDADLRPFLKVSILRVAVNLEALQEHRCAQWKVTRLASMPLLPVTALPLDRMLERAEEVPEGWTAKYVVMLDVDAPTAFKAGSMSLNLMLSPAEAHGLPSEPVDEESEAPLEVKHLELKNLKADHVIRWSGETAPNDLRLVLRERLTVPMGGGDVTATFRIVVSGLPDAYLQATLVAQLPPEQHMRPKSPEGTEPEPFAHGAPIEPKEYGGRLNWLASCKPVAEESGPGVVVMQHVVLCEGSIYRLDVSLDPFRGPGQLEGGTWLLEVHGSGEVEAGEDKMEQDLEALVYKSFERPDETYPTRKDKAAASRLKWRRQQGLVPAPTEEELRQEQEAAALAAAAALPSAGKGKSVSATPQPLSEEELKAKAAAKQEAVDAALRRATGKPHPNRNIANFISLHSEVPPVLVCEDPWVVVPQAHPPGVPVPPTEDFETSAAEDEEETKEIARFALGAEGQESVRCTEVEEASIKWDQIHMQMESAKEANEQAMADLAAWREQQNAFEQRFLAERAELQGSLQVRSGKRAALKTVVGDSERTDVDQIRQALEEAEKAEVGVWDKELMKAGEQKVAFLETVPSLQALLDRFSAEPDIRAELQKAAGSLRDTMKQLQDAKVPLPPDIPWSDLLANVEATLAASAPGEADEGAEGEVGPP